MSQRVQRKRVSGWRMPPGAIYVGRGSRWGNPYRISETLDAKAVTLAYQDALYNGSEHSLPTIEEIITHLRDRDLACWCPLSNKEGNATFCHADVLLKIANT